MFSVAVRWGYLPASPVGRARLPKGPKWTPHSPEPEHVASRIAAAEAKDPDLGVFARMAVAIGARRGELAGLRWSAIDFEQGFVRIDSAVVSTDEDNSGKRTGARLETKDTKTHAERFLALDAGTAKALREMRRRHVEAALACGVPYPARRVRVARERRRNASGAARSLQLRLARRSTRLSTMARTFACTTCVTSTARCSSAPASRCRLCATVSVTRA